MEINNSLCIRPVLLSWLTYYLLSQVTRTTSPLIIGEILVPLLYRQNYLVADHRRDFFPLLYRQNYLAAEHRRDFGSFIIQTELPRRWTSARFWLLQYYADRITSPLIIGEILVASLYRQNYLAAEHRRDFGSFIIQTELPRRWTSARFWLLQYYADRITSPLIIGEILVPLLYRQTYLAAGHRRDFGSFTIQTELPRRWSSARFWFLYYTDGTIPRCWTSARFWLLCYTDRITSARFWFLYYTDRITSPLSIGEEEVLYVLIFYCIWK